MPTPPRPRALLALTAALLFVACRGSEPAPQVIEADAAADASSAENPAGSVSLELRNEPVDVAAEKLASAAGKAIVIDADAQAVAHCARITLLTGGPIPIANAIRLFREALDPAGLSVAESEAGALAVRRVPDKPLPDTCAGSLAASPDRDTTAASGAAGKFVDGVRKISENEYEITQASTDLLIGDQAALLKSGRIVPSMRNGATVGMKIFGIRPASALAALGFKNGDLVTEIGGYKLTGPDVALEAYSKLRGAKKVEVTIERRGAPQKLTYRVVEK